MRLSTLLVLLVLDAATHDVGAAAKNDVDESADHFSLELGGDYETGRYGTRRRTTVKSTEGALDVDLTQTTLLSVAGTYLWQTAPAGSIVGHSRVGHVHRGLGPQVSTQGIGDTTLGLDQDLLQESDSIPLSLGLRGELKFGTADVHKGLGSGKTDYSVAGHIAHDWDKVYGRFEVGYSVLGSPGRVIVNGSPEDVQYRNIWSIALGADFELSKATTLGLTFDGEQSSSVSVNDRAFPPSRTFTVDLSHRLAKALKLKADVLKGFSHTSPDWGAGLALAGTF